MQRTASARVIAAGRAPRAPIAIIQPLWADAETVAAAIGRTVRTRNHRQRAVAAVELSGWVAPDQRGTETRAAMTQKRVSAAGGLNAWRV